MAQTYPLKSQTLWLYSTRVHVFMYALLLIATPFILLRNYLVQGIAYATDSSTTLLGTEIKIVPVAAVIVFLLLLVIYRSYITRLRLLSLGIGIVIIALAQQITDYYFGRNYYDLQQNWHYLAYGIYSFIIYRDLEPRGIPLYKIMLITYFSAMTLSLLDEITQVFISSRVFDICDVGKDVIGVHVGMIITYFGGKQSTQLFRNASHIRHRKFRNYHKHPFTLMFLLFVLNFIFLSIGSFLTEKEYVFTVVILTIVIFAAFLAILHLSQFKTIRNVMLAILAALIIVQGYFYFKYRDDNIIYTDYGLTVYKGIPLPFFDIMIHPNGMFRPVDKKHLFNQRDREFLLKQKVDIIVISSGTYGKGGKGFENSHHCFIYNKYTQKATQIIIQRNKEACETFNRLKRENKNVLFILHNTC